MVQAFIQLVKCSICKELIRGFGKNVSKFPIEYFHLFLSPQGYSCEGCKMTVHSKCYKKISTPCMANM